MEPRRVEVDELESILGPDRFVELTFTAQQARDEFAPPPDPELDEDVPQVKLHRLPGDVELLTDLVRKIERRYDRNDIAV